MLRRLRSLILILLFALAGALLGRIAAEVRRRQEAGEDPADIDIRTIRIRPADLVPGLVAAVRVHDQPWSWLRIPSWLAAFSVNLAVAAVGGDLSRFRDMAERYAFGLAGIGDDGDDPVTYETYTSYETYETASAPPATSTTAAEAAQAAEATNTWTVPEGGLPQRDEAEEPPAGFTPFRE